MLLGTTVFALPAKACGIVVQVTFEEDTPDNFLIEYVDGDVHQLTALRLDLSRSIGRAYIDTPYPRARPADKGEVNMIAASGFAEGSRLMTFGFENFGPKKTYTLLVDLDDSGGWDGDHLTDGEIQGTAVSARLTGPDNSTFTINGTFDAKGVAVLGNRACA